MSPCLSAFAPSVSFAPFVVYVCAFLWFTVGPSRGPVVAKLPSVSGMSV